MKHRFNKYLLNDQPLYYKLRWTLNHLSLCLSCCKSVNHNWTVCFSFNNRSFAMMIKNEKDSVALNI